MKTPVAAISVSELISIITIIKSSAVMANFQSIDADISSMKNDKKISRKPETKIKQNLID